MEKKKRSRFCHSITAEAQDGTTVEVGTIAHDFSISLSPDVCFTDLANTHFLHPFRMEAYEKNHSYS